MDPKYYHAMVGGNFRLDSIQAAVVLTKLPHLSGWAQARRANAALYNELLADCAAVALPVIAEGNESVYNQYVVRVPDRDAVVAKLRAANVGCEIYYPLSLHKQACFEGLGYREGDFPCAEQAEKEVLALPIYAELTEEQIRYVARRLRQAVGC
jgi:dTDP-4-amino-4,6-dideoxygalactose transaminase